MRCASAAGQAAPRTKSEKKPKPARIHVQPEVPPAPSRRAQLANPRPAWAAGLGPTVEPPRALKQDRHAAGSGSTARAKGKASKRSSSGGAREKEEVCTQPAGHRAHAAQRGYEFGYIFRF
jgi:hypothetical protein